MSAKAVSLLYAVLMIAIVVSVFAWMLDLLDGTLTLVIVLTFGVAANAIRILVAKGFREFDIKSVAVSSLSSKFRRYLKKHSPWFEELGFSHLGDFQLLPEPESLQARVFLSEGGRCFGELCDRSGLHMYTFVSVFSDGTYLESAPIKPPKRQPLDSVPLRFSYLPGASVVELYEHHREQARQFEEASGAYILRFAPEQWPDVANYGHRLSGWDQHEQGFKWSAPKGIGQERRSDEGAEAQDGSLISV
jgi:hypothetical protein